MSLTITQTKTALAVSNTASFAASGGTEPYVFSVNPGGAGGSIGASTGLYTAPASLNDDPAKLFDTITVTDSLLASTTSQIMVGDALLLFCELLEKGLGLAQGRVFLWDQKIFKPTDNGLFIAVSVPSCKPFGNTIRPASSGWDASEQYVNMLATLDLDIISRGPAARTRKEQVLLALNSIYSQFQQEANSFSIGRLPAGARFTNLSDIDGAAIPYRFRISVNMQYTVSLQKSVDYYDKFTDFSAFNGPVVWSILQNYTASGSKLTAQSVPGWGCAARSTQLFTEDVKLEVEINTALNSMIGLSDIYSPSNPLIVWNPIGSGSTGFTLDGNGGLTVSGTPGTQFDSFAQDASQATNSDIEASFIFGEDSVEAIVGLSDSPTFGAATSTETLFHYGIHYNPGLGTCYATETNGAPIATVAVTPGDVFSIARVNDTVTARKNGAIFATFPTSATGLTSIPVCAAKELGVAISYGGVFSALSLSQGVSPGNTFRYLLQFYNGTNEVFAYEYGVAPPKGSVSYAPGDKVTIERVGNTVFAKKNGVTFYTFVTSAFGTTLFPVSMTYQGSGEAIVSAQLTGSAGDESLVQFITNP